MAERPAQNITVRIHINASLQKVWDCFTKPEHIVNWNFASEDWHCPKSENELEVGKRFTATMASKNGEYSFDFGGTYSEVNLLEKISYSIDGDGRKVSVLFHEFDNSTLVTEIFEPESENAIELQRDGWQSILTNFKNYTENQ
ncbi:polyketide cyclase [Flavobacterium amnicola]|uniref:Polyketide cyclase n=1 Tax=Flavobacterium amnicola TaxID=2506422 RepID=A0A4Q1K0T0_9FLAO|nr:polyketide cyclase [Flavobacterium amnicola]